MKKKRCKVCQKGGDKEGKCAVKPKCSAKSVIFFVNKNSQLQ